MESPSINKIIENFKDERSIDEINDKDINPKDIEECFPYKQIVQVDINLRFSKK